MSDFDTSDLTERELKNLYNQIQIEEELKTRVEMLPKQKNNNVDVYFVRHAESCSNISPLLSLGKASHPPLSYKGIQQAINLGINNEIINMDFDKYYCSPSLRTIMTACLALRRKCRGRDPKNPIILHLNPYLIEQQNTASNLNRDRQNSIVPKKQLKNMINYIKLWFDQHYFNNYNYIDYEFVHIMYDLVLLLNYNEKLTEEYIKLIKKLLNVEKMTDTKEELLNKLIKLLDIQDHKVNPTKKLGIINTDKDISNIYKNLLLFIENPRDLKNLIIYQELNTDNILNYEEIITQLKSFCNDKNFMNNITIKYEYGDDMKHNADIEQFISDEMHFLKNNGDKTYYKILCFSHGATLKNCFKLEPNLKNTEILHYNVNNEKKDRIFNNNIVIDEKFKDTCGSLKISADIIRDFTPTILYNYMINNDDYKMFQVIDNYFTTPEYDLMNDHINENFKVNIPVVPVVPVIPVKSTVNKEDEEWVTDMDGGRYKHKYLKYKHKYLNYKHKQI
jgi:broad specificity phosphatase PhoE